MNPFRAIIKVHSMQFIFSDVNCSLPTSLEHLRLLSLYPSIPQQVRRAENKQRLADVQAKMDCSAMEKAQHPIASTTI